MKLAVLVALTLNTSAIYIDETCLVRQKYESTQDGTHTYIRAWVNETESSSSIIKIVLEFEPEGHPETYDIIEIGSKQIELRRVRKNNHKTPIKVTLLQPLTTGWIEMTLVSGVNFVLNFTNPLENTFSFEGEKERLTEITVEGSFITINCMSEHMYWQIENVPKKIPLESNIFNKFSTFSRKEYIPSIKVGGVNLQLGYYKGVIEDISPFRDELKGPLPGHKEQFITIDCIGSSCKAMVGNTAEGQEFKLNSALVMTVFGRVGDQFVLKQHLEAAPTLKKVAAPTLTNCSITQAPIRAPKDKSADYSSHVVLMAMAIMLLSMIMIILYLGTKYRNAKFGESRNSFL